MKRRLWCIPLVFALVFSFPLLADDAKQGRLVPQVGISGKSDVSAPLQDMVRAYKPGAPQAPREVPMQKFNPAFRAAPAPLAYDPLASNVPVPGVPMPAPLITIEGPSDDDNGALVFRVIPPDTNGDVGPNHYISMINLVFEIFDKTTGATVLGPAPNAVLWTGFGGVCENNNDGDPIVLYDQFAGRWVMSQFEIDSGTQCFAVSTTGDPLGTWHRYAFDVSNGLNDYPKIGVWPDGYYMMFNEFNPSFVGSVAVVVERDKMLTGDPAQFVKFNITSPAGPGCTGSGDCYFGVLPSHVEGMAPPPAGTPNFFVQAFDDEVWGSAPFDPAADFYKVWEFSVNWVTPASSTFTGPVAVSVPEFNANMCGFSRDCIPQPGTTQRLDTLGQFTMYRLVYRNFGSHESLYVSHTTNLGADQAGVRWTELRDPNNAIAVHQTGTHAPADSHSRWMSSIAADKDGNIALGYSISSSTMLPGIRYAGRLASDPLGTLPQTETEMQAGIGVQTGGNRWGDYSSMSIDESDDCTFWYHQEYQQVTGSFDFNTRIGAFKFPSCTQGPTGTLSGTVVDNFANPIADANITIGVYATQTDAAGQYSITIPVGTYDVTASKFGYTTETALGVLIEQDTTTVQDFTLTALPAIMVDGFVTDGSGAGYPLWARVDVTSPGGTETMYTSPENGYFSFPALVSSEYTVTVTSQVPGYLVGSRTFMTGSTDQQENFPLLVNQASCNAPGYSIQNLGTLVSEDFTAGIPGTWTVTTTTTGCSASAPPGWSTNTIRSNLNGGTPPFAVADSDRCGSSVQMNTIMETPAFDLSGFNGAVGIQFNSDWNDLSSVGTLDIWNGSTWSTVFDFSNVDRRGPRTEFFTTTAGNGNAAAKVRFRYVAQWDWWWQVDNVLITKSACAFNGGGLIHGYVTDENTGEPILGAMVSLDSGQSTMTVATPADDNLGDGFYMVYAPLVGSAPGVRTITVEKPLYGDVVRQTVPTPNGQQQQNFALPAGMLNTATTELRMRVPLGGSGQQTLTLSNSGNLDANVTLLEINGAATANPEGPIDNIVLPFDVNTKLGELASMARDANGIQVPVAPNAPVIRNAGEFESEFATGLALPWGAGFDLENPGMWVGNPGIGGGDNLNHHYMTNGTPSGSTVDVSPASGDWHADMAYNARTKTFWQVSVGGNNCIFEWDPVSLAVTGNTICPAFGTSMRGLAHDALRDRYYAGSWNGTQIVEFTPTGQILRQRNVGLGISGLAVNPSTNHVFAQVNNATQLVYVLDAGQPLFPLVGAFQLSDSTGANAYASFEGAGLEMDCAGNLWSVNQTTGKVHVNQSGETGPCVTQVTWLTEDPSNGVVPAQGTWDSTIGFDSTGLSAGCREAQLLVINDTPYGTINLEAGITASFNDVPAGSFGDALIHAIAGAGVTAGCGGGNFCPGDVMTRRTVAVWALRAKMGPNYLPPSATGVFSDVSPESFGADYIEDFYARGITGGCSSNPLSYCPENPVLRSQMAVLLLRTLEGSSYTPPPCEGLFGDLPCSSPFAAWAEELYRRGITGGCSVDPLNYCPSNPTTRGQMAVFTARTFGMPACPQ